MGAPRSCLGHDRNEAIGFAPYDGNSGHKPGNTQALYVLLTFEIQMQANIGSYAYRTGHLQAICLLSITESASKPALTSHLLSTASHPIRLLPSLPNLQRRFLSRSSSSEYTRSMSNTRSISFRSRSLSYCSTISAIVLGPSVCS